MRENEHDLRDLICHNVQVLCDTVVYVGALVSVTDTQVGMELDKITLTNIELTPDNYPRPITYIVKSKITSYTCVDD